MDTINIIRMTSDSIPEVADIEKKCFSSPWSDKSLEILTGDRGIGMICEKDGKVVGYGGMLCITGEGEITDIAVLPEFRGHGYGSAVLDALIGYARNNDFECVTLEVRESNAPARAMYEKAGFTEYGRRRGYYERPREDALILGINPKDKTKAE